jgi:PAS domain-containing protein
VPHLQRVAQLHLQMREITLQNQAIEAALDQLQFGVVIADATGRVLLVNRAAQEMTAAKDGLLLCGGRLTAAQPKEATILLRYIGDAVETATRRKGEGGGSLSIARPSGRRPFALSIAPLSPDGALAAQHQAPAALILITDLGRRPQVLGRRLVELFGLSPAEACLAVGLVAGKRLEDIAEERSVRMPTLRTQMRSILDKTGTDRQADLIRLIVGLPAIRSG